MKKIVIALFLFILFGCSSNTTTTSTITTSNTDSSLPIETGIYQDNLDDIVYHYYIPKILNPNTGFLLFLHGGYMDGLSFMESSGINEQADIYNFIVCFPSQSRNRNVEYYWNWYKEEEQLGLGEEINLLHEIATTLIERYDLNIDRSYVAGFSAGACEAINLYVNYPDIFQGFASVSGLGYRLVNNRVAAEGLMANGIPVVNNYQEFIRQRVGDNMPSKAVVIHGSNDALVNPRNSGVIIEQIIDDNYQYNEEILDTYSHCSYYDDSHILEAYFLANIGHVYCGSTNGRFITVGEINYSEVIAEYFFE